MEFSNPMCSEDTSNFLNISKAKYEAFDYEGALCAIELALISDPRCFLAYINRGVIKQRIYRDYRPAIEDYSQAILINPNLSKA